MSTFFNDIIAALDGRLNTLSGGTPIAWENIKFEQEAGVTFLRPTFLPTETVQGSLGDDGQDVNSGLYQIDVFVPTGSGRTTLPDTISDHFKRGTFLTVNTTTVRVVSASIEPLLKDDNFMQVPVTISWQAITEART